MERKPGEDWGTHLLSPSLSVSSAAGGSKKQKDNLEISSYNIMLSYSVITICLNSENTIQKAIDSVFIQDPLPAEYIFIDGGSTDSTLDIIKVAQKRVESEGLGIKVKLLQQIEKSGIYGAMNMGIEEVFSDIVFILNSDDWYADGTAEAVLNEFSKNADTDIVYGFAFFHEVDGSKFIRRPRSFFWIPFLMPLAHPATFVRKSVYDKLGTYEPAYSLSSDYEFIYRCYKAGVKFCEIRKPLVNMLLGGAANSGRAKARQETYEIGKKYSCCKILPFFAYIARKTLNR